MGSDEMILYCSAEKTEKYISFCPMMSCSTELMVTTQLVSSIQGCDSVSRDTNEDRNFGKK